MAATSKLTLQRISDLCTGCDVREVEKVEVSNKEIAKIDDISSCAALKRLNVGHNSLSSLKGIAGCKSLTWLNVSSNNLTSLRGVENLVNLSVLNASHNSITASGNLSSLRNLKALILSNNALKDIQGLESMSHLNALVLSSNQFEVVDVCKLASLEKLSLSHNQLQHIPDTSRNGKLKELRVNENQISRIPPTVQKNTSLQLCDLGNNLICKWKNVSVLCQLKKLKSLNLKGNELYSRDSYGEKVRRLFSWVDVLDGRKQSAANSSRTKTASDDKSQNSKQSGMLLVQDSKSSKATPSRHSMSSKGGGQHTTGTAESGKVASTVSRVRSQAIPNSLSRNVDEQIPEDDDKDLLASSGDTSSKKTLLSVPEGESVKTLHGRKRKHSSLSDSRMQNEKVSSTGGFAEETAESRPTDPKMPKQQKSSKSNRKQSCIVKVKHVRNQQCRPACLSESLQSVLSNSPTDLLGLGKTMPSW